MLLFSCAGFHTVAQQATDPYRVQIDSLQNLLSQQSKADTTTVKRLNYLARYCFFDMQFQRGLLAAVKARQLADKLHYAKGDGLYWLTLAYFNNYTDYTYSFYYYLARWSFADRKQSEEDFQPGAGVPDYRKNPKAQAQMQLAIDYFEKHPDREVMANLLLAYAGYIPREEQAPYIEKSVRLLRENNQPALPFFIKRHEITLLEKEGKVKEAKEAEIETQTILASTKDSREKALMYFYLGQMYTFQHHRMDLSFESAAEADKLLERFGEKQLRISSLYRLGIISADLNLHKKATEYLKKSTALAAEDMKRNAGFLADLNLQIAFSYIKLKEFEEARNFINKARKVPIDRYSENFKKIMAVRYHDATGQLLMGQGATQEALKNFNQALSLASQTTDSTRLSAYMTYYIAQCYQKLGQLPESIRYGKLSHAEASPVYRTSNQYRVVTTNASLLLAEVYEQAGQPLEAYRYLEEYQELRKESDQKDEASYLADVEIRSTIQKGVQEKNRLEQERLLQDQRFTAIEKQREIDGLKALAANQLLQARADQAELDKKLEKQRLEAKALQGKRQQDYRILLLNLAIANQRKIRTGLLGGLALFALFVVALVRQNRVRQRFNQTLVRQKAEIEHQRDQTQQALAELKSTQAQLIQKEKLASLGELTAGIAHEIQNPLNFVNNYSEVNVELMEEMEEELKKGDLDEAHLILTDLRENESKIHHHGRRADSIVRGMLEHARTTPGERQPTDLNALAGEYLRLAYQGQRARDSDFDCELVTDFAPNVGEVEVVPQEVGRVLLNLYNNAFYAVAERAGQSRGAAYRPTVRVSTQRLDNGVQIRVSDNGTGMPEAVKVKIFQPFFTTKPTGEGTGLGLSLSYDIITKGYGSTLTVESVEGQGTQFTVTLTSN